MLLKDKREVWKVIEELPKYAVSNHGRVKLLARGNHKEVIKKLKPNKDGYLVLNYTTADRTQHSKVVHRIVAKTFIENPENKETVNHIDGNKQNNHVDNLEWATRSEQLQHSYKIGLKKPISGINNVNAKLTLEQVKYIRNNFKPKSKQFGMIALSKQFNVSTVTIMNVVNNRTYIK